MLLTVISGDRRRAPELLAAAKGELPERDWALAKSLCESPKPTPVETTSSAEEQASDNWDQMQPMDTPAPIQLYLPASWFSDHDDPVKTHPIFLRYLPEARVRNSSIPRVDVKADYDLEPGGYKITIEGGQTETGKVEPNSTYFPSDSLALLGLAPETTTPLNDRTVAVWRDGQLTPLAELLGMTPVEFVVRRLESMWKTRRKSQAS